MTTQKDKGSLCFATGGANFFTDAPQGSQVIELRQVGRDNFSVRYGLQYKERLSYGAAARELGACIMHLAACNGTLDNRERREPLPRKIPADFPVRVLRPGDDALDRCTCGTCGRSWDDAIPTSYTPAPSGRCPFEYFHGSAR